jgi:hypothetical protein
MVTTLGVREKFAFNLLQQRCYNQYHPPPPPLLNNEALRSSCTQRSYVFPVILGTISDYFTALR